MFVIGFVDVLEIQMWGFFCIESGEKLRERKLFDAVDAKRNRKNSCQTIINVVYN